MELTLKVTKKTILKALATEPLDAGLWANSVNQKGRDRHIAKTIAKKDRCEVCAVGAVLREAVPPRIRSLINPESFCESVGNVVENSFFDYGGHAGISRKELEGIFARRATAKDGQDSDILTGISYVFESESASGVLTQNIRPFLIRLVKKYVRRDLVIELKELTA